MLLWLLTFLQAVSSKYSGRIDTPKCDFRLIQVVSCCRRGTSPSLPPVCSQ